MKQLKEENNYSILDGMLVHHRVPKKEVTRNITTQSWMGHQSITGYPKMKYLAVLLLRGFNNFFHKWLLKGE